MNLITDNRKPGLSGNYFCTWCQQGGAAGMCEEKMFGENGIISTYTDPIKKDLIVVFDDGWDITPDTRNPEEIFRYGVGYPDPTRFPSTEGMKPAQALKWLVDKASSYGFAGVGFWIAIQCPCPEHQYFTMEQFVSHWTECTKWANEAGVKYWKVDWGEQYWNSAEARENLTKIVREYAPDLLIEHAHVSYEVAPEPDVETNAEREAREEYISRVFNASDYYRTYDCGGILAVPTTVARTATLLKVAPSLDENNGCRHMINVEDDVYFAAAMGFTAGIMRHPVNSPKKHTETVRALNWQKIMPPFPVRNKGNFIDEEWIKNKYIDENNKLYEQSAPARLSRNIALPEFKVPINNYQPWLLCAAHPESGAVGLYSTTRTIPRWKNCWSFIDVTITVPKTDAPIGVFGNSYHSLTVIFPENIEGKKVYIQDLASDTADDVTTACRIEGNRLYLLMEDTETRMIYGQKCNKENDESAAAFVMQLI